MTTFDTTSLLDLFSPEWTPDPYPFYAALRESSPVLWDEYMHSWAVLGHSDITALLQDKRLTSARITAFYESLPEQSRSDVDLLSRTLSNMMLFNEPPGHTRLRRLIKPGLSPRFVRNLRPMIEQLADDLLDPVLPHGRMDVIDDFSAPLSREIIARLSGISGDAVHLLEDWRSLLHEFFYQSSAQNGRIEALREYFDRNSAARRAGTSDDLFTQMISKQLQASEYTEDEIFANFLLLIDAGQATTTHFIGNAVYALLNNPDQEQRLRGDIELTTNAVNELMRYDSSVQFTTRTALTDIDIGGRMITAGDSVTLVLGAGNRDGRHYAEPDRLDITRRAADHLSFGYGIHYCLGASLAMTVIDVALRKLLTRTTDWKLIPENPERLDSINFRFISSLPITFQLLKRGMP